MLQFIPTPLLREWIEEEGIEKAAVRSNYENLRALFEEKLIFQDKLLYTARKIAGGAVCA
jgi:hypothetical protein